MPDQVLHGPIAGNMAAQHADTTSISVARVVLFGLPLAIVAAISTILIFAFNADGLLSVTETVLIGLMAVLIFWEAIPTANAVLGFFVQKKPLTLNVENNLSVAILLTIRDDDVAEVITKKLELLGMLQKQPRHQFSLHILSDSTLPANIEDEQRAIRQALPLPVFYYHRPVNIDFKSGNIRNWLETSGAPYDAFITLDADSEIEPAATLNLADELSADPACALIQTVPLVLPGNTLWQNMQSVASRLYGGLQGRGLSAWMQSEANYFGHNAIIRTRAFAASAGLPRLKGPGLWNGTILSHDFVEAALLRRAGWTVRLRPTDTGSYEQAPENVIAHLKRDMRWCLGNFQHSRVLRATGLHAMSRFHLISGIFTYLSSVLWLATLLLWGALDMTKAGASGALATLAMTLVIANLLAPRVLGVIHTSVGLPVDRWLITKQAFKETFVLSLLAPTMMLQRVLIIAHILGNRRVSWAPQEKTTRNILDYFVFHMLEVLTGLGVLASVERGFLTLWFLPLALCLLLAPILSWWTARPTHTKI